jgi:hypothetical protein
MRLLLGSLSGQYPSYPLRFRGFAENLLGGCYRYRHDANLLSSEKPLKGSRPNHELRAHWNASLILGSKREVHQGQGRLAPKCLTAPDIGPHSHVGRGQPGHLRRRSTNPFTPITKTTSAGDTNTSTSSLCLTIGHWRRALLHQQDGMDRISTEHCENRY